AATAENEFGFGYLPRIDRRHHAYHTALEMLKGGVAGYFLLGENPAVGNANSGLHRRALAELDWLVARDFFEIESAAFWYDSPEVKSGDPRTGDIKTEVFLLPAAAHTEKDGSFTNTQRLLQWHHKAVEPKGDCRSELWFMYHLGRLIREKLRGSTEPRDQGLLDLLRVLCGRGEPAGAAEARLRAVLGGAGMGVGLAGQPPAPLQPRLRRPRRHTLVRAQALRLVGRRAGTVDRPRRARLHQG